MTFHDGYEFASCTNPADVKYFILGKEVCPTTGKSHGQAYVELVRPMRMRQLKSLLGSDTVHCEQRNGTRDQARDYCMKEDPEPFEYGEWSKTQGSRCVTRWAAQYYPPTSLRVTRYAPQRSSFFFDLWYHYQD